MSFFAISFLFAYQLYQSSMVSPSCQWLPSSPPEKRWVTAHSCDVYPGLSCAQNNQSQTSILRFQNLNLPKWSVQKTAPVQLNASVGQLWGRQCGTSRKQQTPTILHTVAIWVNGCVCCDANKCSCFYKGVVNRSEHAYEPVRRWLDEELRVSDLLRSSVSWPWTGYVLSRIRSTSNWATCQSENMG